MNPILVVTPNDIVGIGVLLSVVVCGVVAGIVELIKIYWSRRG